MEKEEEQFEENEEKQFENEEKRLEEDKIVTRNTIQVFLDLVLSPLIQ